VVHDVPNEYRRQLTGENGEIFETIDQLDDYAVSAYNDRCSFKALGVPWAVEPAHIELSDYRGFEARHFTSEESASMLKKT